MTAAQILARFDDVDPFDTLVCDLDDSEFAFGGRVTDIVRECGYDESGRAAINQQNAWGMSLHEWAHVIDR